MTLKQNRAIYALVRKLSGLMYSGEQLLWLSKHFGTNPTDFNKWTFTETSNVIAKLQIMRKNERFGKDIEND